VTEEGKCWELDIQLSTAHAAMPWNLNGDDTSFVKDEQILEYVHKYKTWPIGEKVADQEKV
jgi:hypothetical protein